MILRVMTKNIVTFLHPWPFLSEVLQQLLVHPIPLCAMLHFRPARTSLMFYFRLLLTCSYTFFVLLVDCVFRLFFSHNSSLYLAHCFFFSRNSSLYLGTGFLSHTLFILRTAFSVHIDCSLFLRLYAFTTLRLNDFTPSRPHNLLLVTHVRD